jgi:hypothetical protein
MLTIQSLRIPHIPGLGSVVPVDLVDVGLDAARGAAEMEFCLALTLSFQVRE